MFKQRDQLFPYFGEVKDVVFSVRHFQRFLQGSHEKLHIKRAATFCLAKGEVFPSSTWCCPGNPHWLSLQQGCHSSFLRTRQLLLLAMPLYQDMKKKSPGLHSKHSPAWGIPQAPFCSPSATLQGNPPSKWAFVIFRAGIGASHCRKTSELEGAEPAGDVPGAFESDILFHRN